MTPREFYIPKPVKIVFVSDYFADDLVGGAELTTEALLRESPLFAFKLHSSSLTEELLEQNKDKFWIFGNWSGVPSALLLKMALDTETYKYAILEYDYKFCSHRSTVLHHRQTGEECQCHTLQHGKVVGHIYTRATAVFFMSEAQRQVYFTRFPSFAKVKNSHVLSSVWTPESLDLLNELRKSATTVRNQGRWAVLGGGSWIKNQEETEKFCKSLSIPYDLVGGLEPKEFLKKLSEYRGLVFHPAGADTCPRLVVEAKLLGLELNLNSNVQHADEEWFATEDLLAIENYLRERPNAFYTALKPWIHKQDEQL